MTKRYSIYFVILLVIIMVAGVIWQQGRFKNEPPKEGSTVVETDRVEILVKDESFEPAKLQIKSGTTVVFINAANRAVWPASNVHPTHDLYPAFDPLGPVEPGEEWEFTFDKVGIYGFHDHLRAYLTGEIKVIN